MEVHATQRFCKSNIDFVCIEITKKQNRHEWTRGNWSGTRHDNIAGAGGHNSYTKTSRFYDEGQLSAPAATKLSFLFQVPVSSVRPFSALFWIRVGANKPRKTENTCSPPWSLWLASGHITTLVQIDYTDTDQPKITEDLFLPPPFFPSLTT